eukprot:GHRR01026990.1.p1 GENE.GHRR01026990.1~~GHRR01026990.1.p1  ORF type:complete len:290 (-),score=71.50 GHRR01026990.1:290-1159(-)
MLCCLLQLPSFNDLSLVSLLGAVMSLAYCIIAVVMSAISHGSAQAIVYDPAAVPRAPIERVMGIFNALTTILFAYGGHNVALEMQATIPMGGRHPMSTVPAMMKGVNITFLLTGLCYFGVSIVGFWAFGTSVPENVLLAASATGAKQHVVAAANLMVVIHVAAAWQVYTQPVFSLIDNRLNKNRGGEEAPTVLRFGLRLAYVALITLVAILIPFFGALMGFFGAVAITPTTFLLPPLLWLLYKRPAKWGPEWAINWILVIVTGILGVLGAIGSVYSIVEAWSSFCNFAT